MNLPYETLRSAAVAPRGFILLSGTEPELLREIAADFQTRANPTSPRSIGIFAPALTTVTLPDLLQRVENHEKLIAMGDLGGIPEAFAELLDNLPAKHGTFMRQRLALGLVMFLGVWSIEKVIGGMIQAFEILQGTPAVAQLIREGRYEQMRTVMQSSASAGMITLDDYLLMLYRKGRITRATTLAWAKDQQEMLRNLGSQ